LKKIGILYGNEAGFPQFLAEKINHSGISGVTAEFVKIDKVLNEENNEYNVILDRISNRVYFYREYLKLSGIKGTLVINNPFLLEIYNRFTALALAKKEGLPVPKMVLLPTNEHPHNTDTDTFVNLLFPLDWKSIFGYTGFPAFFKSSLYDGIKNVCKVNHENEFYYVYNDSGVNLMMLQEAVEYDEYYRVYSIGNKDVRILKYTGDEINPLKNVKATLHTKSLLNQIKSLTVKVNTLLGLEINSAEFAVKDNKLFLTDVFNPVPKSDIEYLGEDNFNWLLDKTADYLIKQAEKHSFEKNKLPFGSFISRKPLRKTVTEKVKTQRKITAKNKTVKKI